jgi:hypothetical protein
MTLANYLNIAGIICATIGSALVFFFIVEVSTNNHKEFLRGGDSLITTFPSPTPELRKKMKKERDLSRLGIFLIVLGGTLQIAGVLM